MKVSVITCTYNPNPSFFRRVLGALQAQTLPKEHWEYLLVDNASKEPVASAWDLSWHAGARHVLENNPGKINALVTGILEARGELVVIVDDDNVLAPDYLEQGISIGETHPHMGVWGGSCFPEFEVQPPQFLEKYLNRLAIRTVSRARWGNSYVDFESIPAGAGMVIRRAIAERYVDEVTKCKARRGLDPCGKSLLRCEDTDLAWTAIDMGLSAGRFPKLKLTHLIARGRVEPKYMLALIEADAISRVLLDKARKQNTFPAQAEGFIRSIWLRLRLSDFDYSAWKATQEGIRRGLSMSREGLAPKN